MTETVLVLGAGAREHALVRALQRSSRAPQLVCAPGNPGIAQIARVAGDVDIEDPAAVVAVARSLGASLVVVGPEAPLVAGVSDALTAESIPCVGPSREAARLEGSKAFCKEIMRAAGVPTAGHAVVEDPEAGLAAVERYPVVLKADGLAAGKGVIIAADESQARAALDELLVQRRFDTRRVLVEEFLVGEELSLLALCDGRRALPLSSARDYKPLGDGDTGPNTGGMGAYSPVAGIDGARAAQLCAEIHQPVLDEMARRGSPFRGILYAGLMLTADGPRVLEFNARFGDPETQSILPRLRSDLLALLEATTRPDGLGATTAADLDWDPRTAVTIVLAAAGYPDEPRADDPIDGLDGLDDAVEITHAGTRRDADGGLVTAGGRVLGVTALGDDAAAARIGAYAAARAIEFDGRQLRSDIALEGAR